MFIEESKSLQQTSLPKFIRKRDDSIQPFNFNKISKAIDKAVDSFHDKYKNKFTNFDELVNNAKRLIELKLFKLQKETIYLEDIQDIVIESLKDVGLDVLAYHYETYRKTKEKERKIFNERVVKFISSYIDKATWKVNENANMGYSVQGLNLFTFSKLNEIFWKEVVLQEISKYHDRGDLHIHDLYLLAPYCVGWDLRDLLEKGFGGVKEKIECDPPKHFDSACGQIVNFLYTLQGEAAGAVSFSNVDTYLAPFIINDGLHKDKNLLTQYMQKFLYNMCVDTRVGFQCLSEDTEILTEDGWKTYDQITIDDEIYTFNLQSNQLEILKLDGLNIYRYQGTMIRFYDEDMDQLVTPNHRTLIKGTSINIYGLEEASTIATKNQSFVSLTADVDTTSSPFFITTRECTINRIAYEHDYDGIVWCPTTTNGTVIARRNGKIFITGNSPFSNFTLDLEVPEHMQKESVILDGKYQPYAYGEFQEGLDAFNDAFCDIMMKGDKNHKVFTFPIPTYCIDENFNWDNPKLEKIWKMTGKYGIPYFANYINTGMNKGDARSMCPLRGDEYVLVKDENTLKFTPIYKLQPGKKYYVYSQGKLVPGTFNEHGSLDMIKVTLVNGHEVVMATNHLNLVLTPNDHQERTLKGEELKEGMYLPYSKIPLQDSVDSTYEEGKAIAHQIINIDRLKLLDMYLDKLPTNILNYDYKTKCGIIQALTLGYSTNGYIKIYNEETIKYLNMMCATMGDTMMMIYTNKYYYKVKFEKYKTLSTISPDDYIDQNDKFWVKIKSIQPLDEKDTGYCFEIDHEHEPLFTIGSTGILTHNCRLSLDISQLRKRGGGLFGADGLTGSIGVVTINLSRIGYLSKDEGEFIDRLDKLVEISHQLLRRKAEFVERMTEIGMYPYSKHYLSHIKQRFGRYWANHFLTIGIIAMHEACLNLLGQGIDTKEGHAFAIRVMKFLNRKCLELQEKYEYFTNLEASPAEGVSYKLAQKDKEMYPNMPCFKIEDKIFYTNSTNLPVNTSKDIWEALEHQEELQSMYTGGTVFHGFLGQNIYDPNVVKNIIKRVLTNYKIPYFNLTPTFSICKDHGYISGNHDRCPKCGKETLIYSRVVGYLRPVNQWNIGKKQEFKMRTTFEKDI